LVDDASSVRRPWYSETDVVPVGLASSIADEQGPRPNDGDALVSECPLAPELLRSSPGRSHG
jgi:hypothetical protein